VQIETFAFLSVKGANALDLKFLIALVSQGENIDDKAKYGG